MEEVEKDLNLSKDLHVGALHAQHLIVCGSENIIKFKDIHKIIDHLK